MSIKIDREFVKNKITTLFEYRRFPFLFDQIGEVYDKGLMEKLEDLQFSIYILDHHLETVWDIEISDLDHYWKDIYTDLSSLEIPTHKHDDFCKHIYKYQRHELQLRESIYPDRFKLNYFYFYKSCDVKLIRRIMYSKYPKMKTFASEGQWRLFDYVTEVNDDIEDVFEDTLHYNANPFLIGILQNGKDQTYTRYTSFLTSIQKELHLINNPLLREWTQEVMDQTFLLLDERMDQIHTDKLNTKMPIKGKEQHLLTMA